MPNCSAVHYDGPHFQSLLLVAQSSSPPTSPLPINIPESVREGHTASTRLVVLAALVLGDLITARRDKRMSTVRSISHTFWGGGRTVLSRFGVHIHVVLELLQVGLLLAELLLELQKLLLLALADRIVLIGLLALLEGITGFPGMVGSARWYSFEAVKKSCRGLGKPAASGRRLGSREGAAGRQGR